jgi:hypothetical protein
MMDAAGAFWHGRGRRYHPTVTCHFSRNQLIISHRHRFIFFAVPRTGTHTMRRALAPHLDDGDWEQQDLFEKKRLPIADLARMRHGHISVRQLQPHLPRQVWQSYFKFAVVRNPFDRFVSTCCFLVRRQPQLAREPTAFMKRAVGDDRFRQRILVRPQSELLTNDSGEVTLDYIGRFEHLEKSCADIFERIGLPVRPLEKRNASRHDSWPAYYDDALRNAVAALYRDDLESFGYDFDHGHPG